MGIRSGAFRIQRYGKHGGLLGLEEVGHGLRVVGHRGHGCEEIVRVEPKSRMVGSEEDEHNV